MESQVQVVFRKNTERVKSGHVAGEWVSDKIGGMQVGNHRFEHVDGAVSNGEGSSPGGFGHLLQDAASGGVMPRFGQINGVEQCAAGNYCLQGVIGTGFADRVVAVGKQDQNWSDARCLAPGKQIGRISQGIE